MAFPPLPPIIRNARFCVNSEERLVLTGFVEAIIYSFSALKLLYADAHSMYQITFKWYFGCYSVHPVLLVLFIFFWASAILVNVLVAQWIEHRPPEAGASVRF